MPEFQFRFVRIPWWQFVLGAGIALAVLLALFFLALGFFLFLLPAIALLGAVFYLLGGRRPAGRQGATNNRIIDGDYRVVEKDRHERRDQLN